MTYRELLYKATRLIDKGEITLGEYEEMTKPLDRDVEQESVLNKIRAEIMDFEEELFHRPNTDYTDYAAVRHCVEIIDKYRKE